MRIDHGPVHTMQVHHHPTTMQVHHHPTLADKPHVTENLSDDSTGNNTILAGFERKGQQWFVATELQSDLVVEVGEMHFHLHKFPLLSRSGMLNRLVFDSRDVQNSHIKLDGMPGGPEAFELASKFCYGVSVELTSDNVAALRCAAEYLEMTEELEEGNLVSKTEAFISFAVLPSWKESIVVLKNCEKLLPWAENLHIVRRCCESIAWKACTDPQGIRWSFTERAEALKGNRTNPLWVGGQQNPNSNSITDHVPSDWWFEDISVVCISFFKKIIQAIRIKGMKQDLIGSAIVHYAIKWLPELSKNPAVTEKEQKEKASNPSKEPSDGSWVQDENRNMVETLLSILPAQKDAVPCAFLLRMLRLAKMLRIKPELITDLEKRAGLLLDHGTLSDLLIPTFDPASDTMYDVDLVQRLLDCFLSQDFSQLAGNQSHSHYEHKSGPASPNSEQTPQQQLELAAKMRVAKLIDNYLVEVSGDQNLNFQKFLALAESPPEHTRATDDGLYKALDTYLKAHPHLTELDRKKLCRTLDYQRLSLDACMHAAQNERLPLRVVVQVLFGEQMKLRNAVTGSKDGVPVFGHEDESHSPAGASSRESTVSHGAVSHHDKRQNHSECSSGHHHHSDHHGSDGHLNPEESEEEIKTLKCDMERMRGKFMALQHDYSAIQQQLEKLTKHTKHQKDHHHKDHHHHHHKDHHHLSVWKKLIPHPHFHLPHLLTHPLEIFHHKDHHHKDHHDHHHHGKDSHHHSHVHHHGKDSHHQHDQIQDGHEHRYLPKGSRSFEEPRSSKDSSHSSHHDQQDQQRSSEARISSSHLSSSDSSSRSKEDPSSPADIDEHKHHKHFPNPIKKWRNSIS